ncbi:uncharacterized protein FRV6_01017 [Fusarium oxysporum]|uniref:Zn(2)-C6 fungal-type domain-containing protein n=1 Tax=Fusarium oxysporum TaxID=5507 RepID=A0A2H3STU5_FUSOX|nr:uncharacterized protein FRV6_01017 [Fusarium oxysporum]
MSNRQRNTTSCNECKRRKLRCDAQQPQCGSCLRSNTLCEVSSRGKRGPKRGHLNALRNRLGQLEEMLQSRFELEQIQELQTHQQTGLHYLPTFESQLPDTASLNLGVPLDSPLPPAFGLIDPVVHAELDQLYFDRVHPSFQLLHQASYLVWSRSTSKSIVQTCLQRIMWIIAILLSTQFRELIEPLYTQVKKDLESSESFEVEHAQSWTLLTVCELMRASYSQAWISAGRMFRLVQGLRYHEIDSPDKVHSSKEDSTCTEEKRRVFWMAYLLDHLFGMRNDWPVTLSEHMICTKLPVPDSDFQGNCMVSGNFISQAITDPASQADSPFNDCLAIVTLCGRGLLRNRHNNISKAYGDNDSDSSEHWRWLEDILSLKDQIKSRGDKLHPLVTFAQILGQVAEILLCKGVIQKNSNQGLCMLDDCHRRISIATEEIIRLARGLTHLHFSQVHPLMSMPLFAAAEFLYEYRDLKDGALLQQLRDLVDVLGNLKNVNDYEKSYLDLLPRSCISASLDVLRHGEEQRNS